MENLKKIRLQQGFTQKDIAQKLKTSQQVYSRYERGDHEPDMQTLCKLADIFEVSVDYLLGRENEKTVTTKGATDIATNYLKELGLENDKRFKDFAKLYSRLPEMHRTYVLAYLIGYLNSSGINTIKIIGY